MHTQDINKYETAHLVSIEFVGVVAGSEFIGKRKRLNDIHFIQSGRCVVDPVGIQEVNIRVKPHHLRSFCVRVTKILLSESSNYSRACHVITQGANYQMICMHIPS